MKDEKQVLPSLVSYLIAVTLYVFLLRKTKPALSELKTGYLASSNSCVRTIESYLAASNVETQISWIKSAQFEPSENSTSKFMKLSYACFCCCANYFRLSYFSVVPHCREVTFIYYSSLEVVSLALYLYAIHKTGNVLIWNTEATYCRWQL